MPALITRIINFISSEKWAGIRNFVGVLAVLVAVFFFFVPGFRPNTLDQILSNDDKQVASDTLGAGHVGASRAKANRCLSQLNDAIATGNSTLAETAARCAEHNYLVAVSEQDDLGHLGLFELYREDRYSKFLDASMDLEALSHEHWCAFAISEKATSLGMTELYEEIVCN